MWSVAAGVFALLSVVLLRLGLRGRLVTSNPVCRRCHFDLIGSVAARCPECGAQLSLRQAVREGGLRKRRWWVLLVALLCFVLFMLFLACAFLPSDAPIG